MSIVDTADNDNPICAVVDAAEVARDPLEARDLPEIPFGDASYRAMWDRVVSDLRERNRFRHLRDFGRSRSSILTEADLQRQLGYLDGWPETQRAAIEAFKERQAERDAEMARGARREGTGKRAARTFMAERRAFLKTLSKSRRR